MNETSAHCHGLIECSLGGYAVFLGASSALRTLILLKAASPGLSLSEWNAPWTTTFFDMTSCI